MQFNFFSHSPKLFNRKHKMRAIGTANPNDGSTITLPKNVQNSETVDIGGAQDTIYLCNFRVSVDGEWLCLKELQDLDIQDGGGGGKEKHVDETFSNNLGIESVAVKCDNIKVGREWVNYYCRCLFYYYVLIFNTLQYR